ncbi:Chromosome partition protein Smc [Carpediemonas membranifera]|uniref:Chromosome partition protein Smc n=1 Tax=Carpediemonas membranifera TaxID=201153 RepID=A0A8J6AYJ6_9EUKA|nr:Chromosome partition protein Smc [Carpediemonas membranifera]|eukprot:KAG9394590.1 Chromosome partition protein Smc [Carpediemonas membranifera]
MQEQIAALQRQMRELVDANANLKARIYSAEVDKSLHIIEVAAMKKLNAKLTAEVTQLKETRQDADSTTKALNDELRQAGEELTETKAAAKCARFSLKEQSADNKNEQKTLEEYAARITALEAELKARDAFDAEASHDTETETVQTDEKMLGTIAELREQLAHAHREAEELRSRLSASEARTQPPDAVGTDDAAKATITELNSEVERLKASENEAGARIAALQHEIDVRDADERKTAARSAELEAAVEKITKELRHARSELSELTQSRADITPASLAELVTRAESAEAEAAHAQAQLRQAGSSEDAGTMCEYVQRITALEEELKLVTRDDWGPDDTRASDLARIRQLECALAELEEKIDESTNVAQGLAAEADMPTERGQIPSQEPAADDMDQLQREYAEIRASEASAAEKIAALQHEILICEGEEPNTAARIAALESSLSEANAALARAVADAASVSQSRPEISVDDLEDLKTQLKSAIIERDQALAAAQAAQAFLQQYGADGESSRATIDDYEARIMALEAEVKTLNEDDARNRATADAQLVAAEDRTTELADTVSELEAKLDQALRDNEALRAQQGNKDADVPAQPVVSDGATAAELQAEISRLTASEDAATEKIAALQHEIDVRDADERKTAARSAELEAAVETATRDLDQAKAELAAAEPALRRLARDQVDLEARLKGYETAESSTDDEAMQRITSLEHELVARDLDDAKKQREVSEKIDRLERMLSTAQSMVAEKQAEIDAMARSVPIQSAPAPPPPASDDGVDERIAVLENELRTIHAHAEDDVADHVAATQQEAEKRAAAEAELKAAHDSLAAAQAETESYRETLRALEDSGETSDSAAVARVHELTAELEQQAKFYQSKYAEHAAELASMRAKVDAAHAETVQAKTDAHAGQQSLIEDMASAAAEREQLEHSLEEASGTVIMLKDELLTQTRGTAAEMKTLDSHIARLTRELDETKTTAQEQALEATARHEALSKDLSAALDELTRYKEAHGPLSEPEPSSMPASPRTETMTPTMPPPQVAVDQPSLAARSTPSVPASVKDSLRHRDTRGGRRLSIESPRPPMGDRPHRRAASFLSRHVQRADMAETEREELNAAREHAADIEYQQNIRKTVIASDRTVAQLIETRDQMSEYLASIKGELPADLVNVGQTLVGHIRSISADYPRSLMGDVTDEALSFATDVSLLSTLLSGAVEHQEAKGVSAIAYDAYDEGAIELMIGILRQFKEGCPTFRIALAKPVAYAVAVFAMHSLSSLSLLEDAEHDIVSEANRDAVSVVMSFVPENEVLLVLTDPLLLSSVATALHVLSSVATCSAGRAVLGAPGPVGFLSRLLDLEGDATAAVMARRSACRCLRNIALPGGATNGAIELDTLTKLVYILRTDTDVETLRFATHLMALALRSRRNQQPDFVESMLDMMSPHLTSPDTETCRNAISCLLVLSSSSVSTVTRPDIVAKLPAVLYTHSDPKPVVMALSTIERVIRIGGVGFDSIAHVQGHPLLPKLVNYLVGPSEDLACKASKILVHFYTAPKEGEERAGFEARVAEFVGTATADNTPALTALSQKLPELMSTAIIDHLVAVGTIVAGISTVPACMDEMVSMGIIPLVRSLLSKTFGPTDAFFHQSEGEYPSAAMSTASVRGRSKNTAMHRTAIILAIARNIALDDARLAQLVDVESPVEGLGLDTMLLVAAHAAEPAVADISTIALELLSLVVSQIPVASALNQSHVKVEGVPVIDSVVSELTDAPDPAAVNALCSLCLSAPKARTISLVRRIMAAAVAGHDASACIEAISAVPIEMLADADTPAFLVKLLASTPAPGVPEKAIHQLQLLAEFSKTQCQAAGVMQAVIATETPAVKSAVDSIIRQVYTPGDKNERVLGVVVDCFLADLCNEKWSEFGADIIAAAVDSRALFTSDERLAKLSAALEMCALNEDLAESILSLLEALVETDPSSKKLELTDHPINTALAGLPDVAIFLSVVKKQSRKKGPKDTKLPKVRASELLVAMSKSKPTAAHFKAALKTAADRVK